MKRFYRFIPNSISIARAAMYILFAALIIKQFVHGEDKPVELIMIFIAVCASDLIDGRIARKMGCTSMIVAKLDILTDLFFIVLSHITLIFLGILPLWFP